MAGVKPLLETVGALLPKIRTWHASPHDFEKYDISKLRTGQGAASYGEGIYQAESKAVSGRGGQYWNEFLNRFEGPEWEAATVLKNNQFDRDKAIADLSERVAHIKGELSKPNPVRTWRELLPFYEKQLELVKSGNPVGPRVYETEISAKPEQMLDWDAPLSAQPSKPHERLAPNIRDIIEQRAENYGVNSLIDVPDAYTGKDLYKTLRIPEVADEVFEALGGRQRPLNEREGILAMDYLNTIDLPVTRYLDQHSRHLGPANDPAAQRQIAAITENIERLRSLGDNLKASELDQTRARLQRGLDAPRTHNYVVRDDKFLEILRKLAIPGLVGGGGAITAYEPQR